jgi:hypothetical protein
MPYVPPTITFLLESAGLTNGSNGGVANGDPSYDDLHVTASTWPVFTALPVWVDGWCLNPLTKIGVPGTYTAGVYSSYELDLIRANPDFALVGDNPSLPLVTTVPFDASHPADP